MNRIMDEREGDSGRGRPAAPGEDNTRRWQHWLCLSSLVKSRHFQCQNKSLKLRDTGLRLRGGGFWRVGNRCPLQKCSAPFFSRTAVSSRTRKHLTFLRVRLKTRERPRAPPPHFFQKVRKSCSFVFLFSDSQISTPDGSRVIGFLLGSDFLYLLVGFALIQTRGAFMLSLSLCDIITVRAFKSKDVSSFLLSVTRPQGRNARRPLARAGASDCIVQSVVNGSFSLEVIWKLTVLWTQCFHLLQRWWFFLYFKIRCHIHIHLYNHIFQIFRLSDFKIGCHYYMYMHCV